MNFPFAITFILEHKKFTRTSWQKNADVTSWVCLAGGIMRTDNCGLAYYSYTPSQEDMLANDWKEVK